MSKARQSMTLDDVWQDLSKDIEHLFQFQTLRYSQWMLLYTHIFDFCTNDERRNSADLYESFRNYLRNHLENLCQSVRNLPDQDLLEFYINQWKKYRISSKILHGICSYLHRYYVRRESESGNSEICQIYPMSMQIWQQVVSRLFNQQISQICLNMIKAERSHQTIDREIISNVIQTYITTNINAHALSFDNDNLMLDVYEEYFENQFLQDTQEFYRLEAAIYLQQHSVIEYLLKILQYFDEEIHRVTAYLHPSTIIKIVKKLEEVLIYDQLIVINAEAKNLIHDEKIQELNLLFQTVNRIENGKIELKNILENHIYQIGIERINSIPISDLKIYIQTIYELHERFVTFIQKAFDGDHEFFNALDRAFRKFVNDNSVIQTMGNVTIMAGCLARHCDKLLRKGKKEEIDLERIFNQIKIVLYYMQEKDVFTKFYSKFLAKRLINQITISHDYEKLMISNIQTACGFEYVYKMKQMCQDIETSENILNQYSKTKQFDKKIKFNVLILNSNAWVFSIPSNIILPNKLQFLSNNFNQFYNQLYNGRKLLWLHQYSKGELQTFYTNQIYTLQVSLYQMLILLLFNNSSELTIEKIYDETQIKIDFLFQILNVLLQSKILISTQINLDQNSTIQLSNNFISEKYCINLNIPMKSLEQNEAEIVHKKIDQDRIMVIQAAIVRIMKLHKTMLQNLLIQTAIEQLNSHFTPDVSIIKNCINILITKEYLERSSNNKDLLCYMS